MSLANQAASAPETGFTPARTPPPLEVNRSLISDPRLLPLADKLARGRRLDRNDGLALMESLDLHGLGALAHAARLAKNQRRAYYVVNRHLNYSNICVNKCALCAFWRDQGQDGAYLMSPEQVGALAAENPDLDIDEFHIVGSCHPDLGLDYYLDLLAAVRRARPRAALKAFTPVEIDHMARKEGLGVSRTLALLQEQGLRLMPGGGAEVFSPLVREKICPRKISGERWLEVTAAAHELGIPTNATMLYGHLETPAQRVDHLLALRDQQDRTGGFNAFIPLSFHPRNTKLSNLSGATGLDDLRTAAASRLLLDNFPHIKAYWVMLGEKLAQVALNFGADDLDGTIIEERITHSAGASSALGLTEGVLRASIEAAGFQPMRRDAFYNPRGQGA